MITNPSCSRIGNIISWITDGHGDPVTAITAQVPSSVTAVAASTAIDTVGRVQRRIDRAITIDAAVPSRAIPTYVSGSHSAP